MRDINGKVTAEVTFRYLSDGVVDIDRTFVDESLRGQGIASELMTVLAKKLNTENKRAKPTCSYAVSWFDKHSEYKDVLYVSPF